MSTIHLLLTDQSAYDDSTPELRVTSAHESDQAARLALADLVLTGTLVRGARIDTVEIAGELAPAQDQGDLEAIASVLQRHGLGKGYGATAREIMSVVGQRMADARTMARQDAISPVRSMRRELSSALGGPDDLDDARTRWSVLLEHVRELAEAQNGTGLLLTTKALRDALGPVGASVQQRSPAELLDLVRDLVKGREAWAQDADPRGW